MSLYSYYFSSIPLKYCLTGSFSSISCGRNFFQFMSYSSKISAFSRNRTFAGLTAQKPSEALTAQGLACGFSPTPNVSQIHKAHELLTNTVPTFFLPASFLSLHSGGRDLSTCPYRVGKLAFLSVHGRLPFRSCTERRALKGAVHRGFQVFTQEGGWQYETGGPNIRPQASPLPIGIQKSRSISSPVITASTVFPSGV